MSDPFETLGLPPVYTIDIKAVEQRHRELSKALHPDRYAGKPAAERRMSLSRAIDVNEAFRAVRDPIKRGEALLRRAGVAVGETNEPKPPPDLLMEMMEAREELSEVRAAKDLSRAKKLGEGMKKRFDETSKKLGATLDAGKSGEALPLLGELRYVRRFLDEVAAIEEELG